MSAELANSAVCKYPLMTKRVITAQVSICMGCCCGNVERGRPSAHIDRMKHEWRTRGLAKFIQLTISGCLGPCDVVNVVRLSSGEDDVWLGNFCSLDDYLDLANWAEESKASGAVAPLSQRMKDKRFDPFRKKGTL